MNNTYIAHQYLSSIALDQENSLAKEVAIEALHHGINGINTFFDNLFSYGCISGIVKKLIGQREAKKFYDKHHSEILNIKSELENDGKTLSLGYYVYNDLCWIAFEEVAKKIYNTCLLLEEGLEQEACLA